MGPRNGWITQTGDRVQQDRRAHRTPLLLGARLAEALQHALLVLAEDQKPTSPLKGHAPLNHRWGHVYSYLENTHLGGLPNCGGLSDSGWILVSLLISVGYWISS